MRARSQIRPVLLTAALVGLLACAISAAAESPTPGAPDVTFGSNGLASLNASHFSKAESANSAHDAVLDSGGRLLIAGNVAERSRKLEVPTFAVVAMDRDGERDPSWGHNGALIERFPRKGYKQKRDSEANAISVLPDGRVFVAGRVDYVTDREINEGYDVEGDDGGELHISRYNFVVFAYDKSGNRIRTFGKRGRARIQSVSSGWSLDSPAKLFDMEVAPDGSIYLLYEDDNWTFRAMRLTRTGKVDRKFGRSGSIRIPVPKGGNVEGEEGAELFSDNSGVTVTYETTVFKGNGTRAFWMATKFTARGKLDTTFGKGGNFRKSFGSGTTSGAAGVPISVERDASGRLVFAGGVSPTYDADATADRSSGAVVRVTSDGKLDSSFGTNGTVMLTAPDGKALVPSGVSPLSDGRYVIAVGSCKTFIEGACRAHAWTTRAIDTSGQPLTNWGIGGSASLPDDFYAIARLIGGQGRVYVVLSELWPKSYDTSLFGVFSLLD